MKKIVKPNLKKPIINGSIDEWGYILNDNIDITMRFAEETIQDLSNKDIELARLDEEKIDKTELSTFVKNTVDNYIETEVEPNLTNTLDKHVTTVNKPDLDSYTDVKKRELDIHEKLKEGQLNTFTTQKESQLNSYVENVNKPELTRFTESQKPIIQGYTEEGKQDITAHTEIKKSELDAKTNELLVEQKKQLGIESGKLLETQKSELDKHEQSKEVLLNNYVNNTSKVDIDNFTDTQKAELNNYVDTTVKPDITKHVDTEKNKSTIAITKHTSAEIERINASTDIKNKLDKGVYVGTAQDLKSDIDSKISKSDIVNNLTTGGTNKVLSAEIGKRLNGDKLDKGGYDGTANDLKSLVDTKLDKDEAWYTQSPIGSIIAFPSDNIPLGWLLCNGQTISQSEYPELYALIGSKVPDFRGQFLRGNDNGRGIDSRRTLLSEQGDTIRNITGAFRIDSEISTRGAFDPSESAFDPPQKIITASSTGTYRRGLLFDASRVVPTSDEVRPKNISVNYCIKAKNVVNPSSAVDVAEELKNLLNDKIDKNLLEDDIFTKTNCLILKSAIGYQKLPSGLIIQWGTIIPKSEYGTVVTFPVSFTGNYSLSISMANARNTVNYVGYHKDGFKSFTIRQSAGYTDRYYTWIAIGY